MYLPNDPARPITRFVLGDRMVISDGRRGVLERIIYENGVPAAYEIRCEDGSSGLVRVEDIAGIESDDGVQLPLL